MSVADLEKAASSKTRIKLANYLKKMGIYAESSEGGRPPRDVEFAAAICVHVISNPYVLKFRRDSEQLKVRIPESAILWLKVNAGEEYNVLDAEGVGYQGKSSTYTLSWKLSRWAFQEHSGGRTYAREFVLSPPRKPSMEI